MMNDSSSETTTTTSDTNETGAMDLFEYLKGPLIVIVIMVIVSLILFFMYIYKYRSPRSRRPSMAAPAWIQEESGGNGHWTPSYWNVLSFLREYGFRVKSL